MSVAKRPARGTRETRELKNFLSTLETGDIFGDHLNPTHRMKPSLIPCSLAPLLALALGSCCAPPSIRAADWPQWRGPNRDGISQEKGLLKEWPKEGPKLLWRIGDAGSGYSTPAGVGGRDYLLGNDGLNNEQRRGFSAG